MPAEAPMDDAKPLAVADEAAGPAPAVSEGEGEMKAEGKDVEDPKGDDEKEREVGEVKEKEKEKEVVVLKSSSFREESNFLSDLKEQERKALMELRVMVDEAIRANKLFPSEEAEAEKGKGEGPDEVKSGGDSNVEAEKEKELGKEEGRAEERDVGEPKEVEQSEEVKSEGETKGEAKNKEVGKEEAENKEEGKEVVETKEEGKEGAETKEEGKEETETKEEGKEEAETKEEGKEESETKEEGKEEAENKEKSKEEAENKEKSKEEEKTDAQVKEVVEKEHEAKTEESTEGVAEITLWGVPLLGSKGSQGTDVILLKFLRAREYKAKDAFEMLRSTLKWRKDSCIDSILSEESLGEGLEAAAYMDGSDRDGHPICYNIYGVFQDSALYEKAFGSEQKVEQFLRWRFQLMERGIQKLDLRPGGVASILQITDLKDSPGISKREIRAAMKRAVGLLQDNYPEFVAKNIFINVPFWYYAFNSLLSPFLTQRTKSKFVFARPARVTETLLKYIPAEDIPVRYGGLKRDTDAEFSVEDGGVSELVVKSGATENVEIPIPEAGATVVWDLTVVGWEVNYKEEFVPTDEASYTILLQKGKKMGSQEQAVRNSFRSNEPGKVLLIIENNTFWKKKVLYRYKTKSSS